MSILNVLPPLPFSVSDSSAALADSARRTLATLPVKVAKRAAPPFFIQKPLLQKILSKLFAQALQDGSADFLRDRWLKIDIVDLEVAWNFSCAADDSISILNHGPHDVCIRGELESFILLAAQKEDPDTLFFQRTLVIEGNTNLGLEVKNLLNNIDLSMLLPELRFALAAAAEFVTIYPNKANKAPITN